MRIQSQNPALQPEQAPRDPSSPAGDKRYRPSNGDSYISVKPLPIADPLEDQLESESVSFEFPDIRQILAEIRDGEITISEALSRIFGRDDGGPDAPSADPIRISPPSLPDMPGDPDAEVDYSKLPELGPGLGWLSNDNGDTLREVVSAPGLGRTIAFGDEPGTGRSFDELIESGDLDSIASEVKRRAHQLASQLTHRANPELVTHAGFFGSEPAGARTPTQESVDLARDAIWRYVSLVSNGERGNDAVDSVLNELGHEFGAGNLTNRNVWPSGEGIVNRWQNESHVEALRSVALEAYFGRTGAPGDAVAKDAMNLGGLPRAGIRSTAAGVERAAELFARNLTEAGEAPTASDLKEARDVLWRYLDLLAEGTESSQAFAQAIEEHSGDIYFEAKN